MTTITEFLLARIAEDEAVAIATRDSHDPLPWDPSDYADAGAWGMGGPMDGPSGYSSVVIDPARVLAECAAKRRIIELRYSWNLQAEQMAEPPFGPILKAQVITADSTIRTLAMPYADHPDYDPAWA